MRIAIIDDDRLSRTVLRAFLSQSGHVLAGEAATGLQGIQLVCETQPDLLLLDLQLPDMNGVDVARRLMELMPTPVVVISAQDEEQLFARAMEAGIHAYLTKPFRGPDLVRAMAIARARFEDAMSIRQLQQASERKVTRLALAHEIVQRLGDMSMNDPAAQKALLGDIARRIQEGFGYYNVNIGLVEDSDVVIIALAGPDAVKQCLGHRLRIGVDGMIGRSAATGLPLLAPDVTLEESYQPALQCPQTRGELVVPLKMRETLIGVLDVRSDEIDALGDEDLEVMGLLAGSMAAVLENARLVRSLQEQGRQLAETNRQLLMMQAQLVKTERLAAIGQTVAAVQHEINNPLTSVLGNVQWLRRHEGFSPEVSALLQVIEREAERIRRVLERLRSAEDRVTQYVGNEQMLDIGRNDPPGDDR